MKTAKRLLDKKKYIKEEMDSELPAGLSDAVWAGAEDRLEEILGQHRDIPKKQRMHPYKRIFPVAAVYLTLKEAVCQKRAYSVIENSSIRITTPLAGKLRKLVSIPGCAGMFVGLFDLLTKKLFGAEKGFDNVFYPKKKGEYRMDVTSCPYDRYLTELGCPEITKIFCEGDDRLYGSLPGIEFIRTKTIGKGGDCCDFYIRRVPKRGQTDGQRK